MKDFIGTEITDSTRVHQEDILMAEKGWFKFSPHIGVGLVNYIDSTLNEGSIKADIRRNFTADGMKVKTVKLNEGQIEVDANY